MSVTAPAAPAAEAHAELWAVVAYVPEDFVWCDWLYRSIHNFKVPADFAGKPTRHGFPRPDSVSSFPDPRSPQHLARINEALAQGQHLLVVCSPHSAKSQWIDDQIRAFKRAGGEERIIAVVVDGEPTAHKSEADARRDAEWLPAWLRWRLDDNGNFRPQEDPSEPLIVDARAGHGILTEVRLHVLKGVLDMPLEKVKAAAATQPTAKAEESPAAAVVPAPSKSAMTAKAPAKSSGSKAGAIFFLLLLLGGGGVGAFWFMNNGKKAAPVVAAVVKTEPAPEPAKPDPKPTEAVAAIKPAPPVKAPEPTPAPAPAPQLANTTTPAMAAPAAPSATTSAPLISSTEPAPALAPAPTAQAAPPAVAAAPTAASAPPISLENATMEQLVAAIPSQNALNSSAPIKMAVPPPPTTGPSAVSNLEDVNRSGWRKTADLGHALYKRKNIPSAMLAFSRAVDQAVIEAQNTRDPRNVLEAARFCMNAATLQAQNSSSSDARTSLQKAIKLLERIRGPERMEMIDQAEAAIRDLKE